MRIPGRLHQALDTLDAAAGWLALPLAGLLLVQWPLRDVVGWGATRANDLGQILFALYVGVGLHAATRTQSHLSIDMALTQRMSPQVRHHLNRWGQALLVLPVSLYVLYGAGPMAWRSLCSLEGFPESFNPGYWLIKVAAWLLALLMSLQAVIGPAGTTVAKGLPIYAIQLGGAALLAVSGVATGAFSFDLMGALPSRLVGLLENDLLQALPLYALSGAVLNRLPLVARMHQGGQWLLRRQPAAAELSALLVSALLAPMNGSVGASLHMLSRAISPRLQVGDRSVAQTTATLCVASTLGVVIAPSLVLLLLGDAMMRAHTEAVNATHAAVRIVNNADVLRAAVVPGALAVLMSLAVVAWRHRRDVAVVVPGLDRQAGWQTVSVVLVIAALLVAVATGRVLAVEAAAAACLLLLAGAAVTKQLSAMLLRLILRDALVLTGVLFALLIAATSLTLVLRGHGIDQWLAASVQSFRGHPTGLLLLVMAGLAACACVLDAFEMIFLVIPLVMPAVLQVQDDAAWVAVLTLLVLQLGFLLPPLGYAVLMARSLAHPRPGLAALSRALVPHLVGQLLLIAVVMAFPQTTRWTRPDEPAAVPMLSDEQLDLLLRP
ncbi:TRAP transporter large permease subunit [Sphaerotilus sp.]|uniref:TRAP transporter large permease subunit n=1 Tax=Sphaerotilus sp. TaxID=2093942 RepID=UPI0034E27DCC